MAEENKQDIKGGCHCGKIKYSFRIAAPKEGHFTATRCNCTFCNKLSTTNLRLNPDGSDFTLLSESTAPLSALGDYQPRVKTLHRYFCQDCGVHCWMQGYFEHNGTKHPTFAVNMASIDQPQEGIDLSKVKMKYFGILDEKSATFELKDTPWSGGLI